MNLRKKRFMVLALTGCLFQQQFLGCSRDFALAVARNFTPAFGQALGNGSGDVLGRCGFLALIDPDACAAISGDDITQNNTNN